MEIGANTTIDRATMGSTLVEKGVKLDNLIQIAHNVEIGENTVIACTNWNCWFFKNWKKLYDWWASLPLLGHLTIADNVKIAGQSGVASSITEKGKIVQGPLAFDIKDFQRSYIILKNYQKYTKQFRN